MMTLAERRIHISGSATSWFVGGAGAGGLVFPFVIGRFFGARGADALPVAAFVLATATFGGVRHVQPRPRPFAATDGVGHPGTGCPTSLDTA